MNDLKKLKLYDYAILISSGLLFILGSLGIYVNLSIVWSIILVLFYIGLNLIFGKKMELPKYFLIYIFFLVILLVHTLYSGGKISYFLLFTSGAFFWFITYNYRDLLVKYFPFFLIFLGFLMLSINIFLRLKGISYQYPDNLFLPTTPTTLHNNMGDLWTIILIPIIYYMSLKRKNWHWIIGTAGLIVIGYSLSRSAILALVVGSLYIFYRSRNRDIIKPILNIVIIASIAIFFYFALYKTTLFSRPYYLEGLISIFKNPFGIGMGNFLKVSQKWSLAYNLILEIASGIGIFSLIFIFWLYKIFRSFKGKGGYVLYESLFLTILILFSFDAVYAIPTMIWIWFSVLALAQNP